MKRLACAAWPKVNKVAVRACLTGQQNKQVWESVSEKILLTSFFLRSLQWLADDFVNIHPVIAHNFLIMPS